MLVLFSTHRHLHICENSLETTSESLRAPSMFVLVNYSIYSTPCTLSTLMLIYLSTYGNSYFLETIIPVYLWLINYPELINLELIYTYSSWVPPILSQFRATFSSLIQKYWAGIMLACHVFKLQYSGVVSAHVLSVSSVTG